MVPCVLSAKRKAKRKRRHGQRPAAKTWHIAYRIFNKMASISQALNPEIKTITSIIVNSRKVFICMAAITILTLCLDFKGVQALLAKLSSKLNIGSLLQLKAEAQGLTITEDQNADEVYDVQWAINAAAVTQLLID